MKRKNRNTDEKKNRKLSLKRESVRILDSKELSEVAGGGTRGGEDQWESERCLGM